MQRAFSGIMVIVVAVTAACVEQAAEDPDIDTPTGSVQQQVNGFVDYGNPEVGVVAPSTTITGDFCTGTAVAPNVVLTARHCMGNANFFLTQQAQGATPRVFTVRGRWSSASTDIGLLWLHQPVPRSRPVKQFGPVGGTAVVYGFGGNLCEPNPFGPGFILNEGIGIKRVAFFTTRADNVINAPLICGCD
jgi:hypothetical protein